MPSVVLPGKDGVVEVPEPQSGRLSVRDLRKSIRLPEKRFQIIRKNPEGTLEALGENEKINQNEQLQAIPKHKIGGGNIFVLQLALNLNKG